jgi:peptidyl-prolyl cis-trans isomerase A (cyclophilin A)
MKAPLLVVLRSLAALRSLAVVLCSLAAVGCSRSPGEPGSVGETAATAAPASATAPASAPTASASSSASVPASPSSGPLASTLHPALLDPSKANERAPKVFKAKFQTSRGDFVVEVHRDWAPNGADRFYNLVRGGFYDDTRLFRAIDGFMVQFGISGDPAVNTTWQEQDVPDDPVTQSNKRGFVTFAQRNTPNTRSTQVFINFNDNSRLDGMRFAPFAQVVQGMDVVDSVFKGYGEAPNQARIQSQGNAYLDSQFPRLDSIRHAEIIR